MGSLSICLSSASILRCDSLTRNQNIFLIIPTALEIIFSTSLVFIDRGPGKRNLLLTAEGLSFLVLVVLELLSNALPAVRGNLHLFEAVDLAIGIASLLPISFYTIFLYLLIITETLKSFPYRIKNITIVAPLFFILATVVSNEITAFTSSSIQQVSSGTIITIGFPSSTNHKAWTIATYLTLALLSSFQAAVLSFALFRLSQIMSHRRRAQCQCSDKSHPIKGIGWISGSLLLGVIETVFGFAVGGFWMVLTRRILRLLTRASLSIGAAKGLPVRSRLRRSELNGFISNPRVSTFQHVLKGTPSPKATQNMQEKSAKRISLTSVGLPAKAHLANNTETEARVSIRYHLGRPSLHLRLSTFDILPSPATIVEQIKSRSLSEKGSYQALPETKVEQTKSRPRSQRHSSRAQPATKVKEVKLQSLSELSPPRFNFSHPFAGFRDSVESSLSLYAPVEVQFVTAPQRTLSQRSARAKLYQAKVLPATSEVPPEPAAVDLSRGQSTKSMPDSLQEAVQDLAGQFPGPPTTLRGKHPLVIPPPIPQALGSPSQLRSEWVTSILSSTDASSDNKSSASSKRTLYDVTGTRRTSSLPPDSSNDGDPVDAPSPLRTPSVNNKTSDPPEARIRKLTSTTAPLNTTRKARPSNLKPQAPWVSISKKDFFAGNRSSRNSTGSTSKRGTLKHIIIPPRNLDTPEILNERDVGGLDSTVVTDP